jgi:hypothetical protein
MSSTELLFAGLGAISAALSAIAAIVAVVVAQRVAQTQKMLSQRQLIIPLWEYMSRLNDIDPEKPVVAHVLDALRALELVALCCEGGMVDEQVIKRTFRAPFMQLYEAIQACPEIETLGRNGPTLLRENPAAMAFYEKLKKEHLERDQLAKV